MINWPKPLRFNIVSTNLIKMSIQHVVHIITDKLIF